MDASSDYGLVEPASDKIDRHLLMVALVVVLGSFLSILDTTIVNVALKHLSIAFGVSLKTIQWVATGYMLALAAVIPASGWAADRFGAKRVYIASISTFVAGSVLAGLATSASGMIVARALQGFGGGMIMPTGMTILGLAAGPQRMGRMLGISGVPMLLAPILGPIVGGWLVDDVSWRWIFFGNVPIGLLGVLAAARVLDRDRRPAVRRALDWRGLVLLSSGLPLFVFGLARVAAAGNFDAWPRTLCIVAGLAFVGLFVLNALGRAEPLIDVRLLKRRPVAASCITTFFFAIGFYGVTLMLPLYFQLVRGQSAFDAGLLVAVQGAGAMLVMPIAAVLTDRIGAGKIVLVGLGLIALGILALCGIESTTAFWRIELTLFVVGMGSGATMMPTFSAGIAALQRHEVAHGNTGLSVVQRIGGSIGTALLAVVLADRIAAVGPPIGMGAMGLGHPPSPMMMAGMLAGMGHAFGYTFRWALGLVVLAIVAALFLPRVKTVASAATAVLMD